MPGISVFFPSCPCRLWSLAFRSALLIAIKSNQRNRCATQGGVVEDRGGRFVLVLRSAVCHLGGESVNKGHYVAYAANREETSCSTSTSTNATARANATGGGGGGDGSEG